MAIGPTVLELAVPLDRLGLTLGDEVELVVALGKDGIRIETLPSAGRCRIQLKSWTGLCVGG